MRDQSVWQSPVGKLISEMTLDEKIGQLMLINSPGGHSIDSIKDDLRAGRIGAILNEVDPETVRELQRICIEESRLRIPLLIGRDVIHGFRTVFPIPLGQAASWDPQLIEQSAHVSAVEAKSRGVNWTYAPMLDICRDPRWGRIAETLGEDPYLTSVLGASMVKGFQGDNLSGADSIAACVKHFAGYGASESGRDYNITNIPENELRNVHLPPFKAAIDAGAATVMTSFSDLNGIPASANEFLLKQVLRNEWNFNGFVVSDWESVRILQTAGLTDGDKESAEAAINAGMDMEMASRTFADHIKSLLEENKISIEMIDKMVENILRVKERMGLLNFNADRLGYFKQYDLQAHLQLAREAARKSLVLLKNDNNLLPLDKNNLTNIAVIGPLADDKYEQLGTWIFDGDENLSETALHAIMQEGKEAFNVKYVRGMQTTRSKSYEYFEEAKTAANESDLVLLFLGEESILSGEAHCRADIGLPGNQAELISAIRETGKPIVLILLAGRPLALENIIDKVDALLYAWHPGTMAGAAIADILFGKFSPSGKLPVTFPRVTGQIPIYYSQKNTGRPATPESFNHIDNLPVRAHQVSVGNTSFHLDTHYTPLFPFGFGLSYTEFHYGDIRLSTDKLTPTGKIVASATVTNTGKREAEETVQLYIRDLAGSITRPVKELKGFKKIRLEAGKSSVVEFEITVNGLKFWNKHMKYTYEPGRFHLWIGGDSDTGLRAEFELTQT